MPRGRWAWTDRHLKQKVINPHTQTQRERERGRRRAGRQSETQCNSTLVDPPLSPFWPPSLALCWRPSTHLHKTHPQLGSRRNFSAFLLFPSCFFSSFLFSTFSYWSIESACGWKGEGGEGRGTSLALGFVAGIVLVPP